MAKLKLKATEQMARALEQRQLADARVAEHQQAEKTERIDTWRGIKDQVAGAAARGEVVESVDRGPINILSRDGLLWLIKKGRLNAEMRAAAEKFRHQYALLHLGGVGSCIANASGSGECDVIMLKVQAAEELKIVRKGALLNDDGLVSIVDAVAGRGDTIRELAKGNRMLADLLEAEFCVACRLLARFYRITA